VMLMLLECAGYDLSLKRNYMLSACPHSCFAS
jgi:hypothetical protein